MSNLPTRDLRHRHGLLRLFIMRARHLLLHSGGNHISKLSILLGGQILIHIRSNRRGRVLSLPRRNLPALSRPTFLSSVHQVRPRHLLTYPRRSVISKLPQVCGRKILNSHSRSRGIHVPNMCCRHISVTQGPDNPVGLHKLHCRNVLTYARRGLICLLLSMPGRRLLLGFSSHILSNLHLVSTGLVLILCRRHDHHNMLSVSTGNILNSVRTRHLTNLHKVSSRLILHCTRR
jgi:hypothetical protein